MFYPRELGRVWKSHWVDRSKKLNVGIEAV